jgi:hypothetical protein
MVHNTLIKVIRNLPVLHQMWHVFLGHGDKLVFLCNNCGLVVGS